MNIVIGGAWPYANGSLHIGHIAALLPGDVLARYHRAKGDSVYYVSGSDCHGTPVAIRAKQEGIPPQEIGDRYHEEFSDVFERFGFSYDEYGKTSSEEHKSFVTEFHRTLYESPYVYEKTVPQTYCETCGKTLIDRFVVGTCPHCGEHARGDQCDACGAVLEPEALVEPRCAVCGCTPVLREGRHLYISLTALEKELTAYADSHPEWRKNASAFTYRYLREGLRDRALTRDLDWGIDVPKAGYEEKKIYIWAENVLGYLSMSAVVAKRRGERYSDLWGGKARHYYVHGKDNIPFHTIILPALLLAHGATWRLPDSIISSEYLTLEGRKISTSNNWAVWAGDLLDRCQPDSLRYFLLAGGPEKRDTDFSWDEYIRVHNGALLGGYGNLANRTLAFIQKYCGGVIPDGEPNAEIDQKIKTLYAETGVRIENGCFKEALDGIFELVRFGNKHYDTEAPWITRTSDPTKCGQTLYTCVQIIANLAVLLCPFLPFSSARIFGWLDLTKKWVPQFVHAGTALPETGILFDRIDPKAAPPSFYPKKR